MIIRSYFNESGDMWVCVIDNERAFVALRPPMPVDAPWSLSYRHWVRIGDHGQKLDIKELGKFVTIEQAQQFVNINIDSAKKIYYSSSNVVSEKTSDIFSKPSLLN